MYIPNQVERGKKVLVTTFQNLHEVYENYCSQGLNVIPNIITGPTKPCYFKSSLAVYCFAAGAGILFVGNQSIQVDVNNLVLIQKQIAHYIAPYGSIRYYVFRKPGDQIFISSENKKVGFTKEHQFRQLWKLYSDINKLPEMAENPPVNLSLKDICDRLTSHPDFLWQP